MNNGLPLLDTWARGKVKYVIAKTERPKKIGLKLLRHFKPKNCLTFKNEEQVFTNPPAFILTLFTNSKLHLEVHKLSRCKALRLGPDYLVRPSCNISIEKYYFVTFL